MVDPSVSLAFSMSGKKGIYALLLGSGLSRSAGVPTGWEIVLDLASKLARALEENCENDPASWYQKKYGEAANYSTLMDRLAKTPAERQQLISSYIEPTPEERESGSKVPTAAHRAIARLLRDGYVRVIVTTNFDRLLETAMAEVGVSPSVISGEDHVAGAVPLIHAGATVLKLHGDYLDTRLRNTETELDKYGPALASLLDRILDEFGLVVCGWSGDWDSALRAAIDRCPTRRFTPYWAYREKLSEAAQGLVARRNAELLVISDADKFFSQLCDRLGALAQSGQPHPLTIQMAASLAKRYLSDAPPQIRLADLLGEETAKLAAATEESLFPGDPGNQQHVDVQIDRLDKYTGLTSILAAACAVTAFWGTLQAQSHVPRSGVSPIGSGLFC